MLESVLVKKIMDKIRGEYGSRVFLWKEHGGQYGTAGIPDIVGVLDGKFFGLEVKSPDTGYRPSQLQLLTHKKIRIAQGTVAVVRSVEEALEVLKGID